MCTRFWWRCAHSLSLSRLLLLFASSYTYTHVACCRCRREFNPLLMGHITRRTHTPVSWFAAAVSAAEKSSADWTINYLGKKKRENPSWWLVIWGQECDDSSRRFNQINLIKNKNLIKPQWLSPRAGCRRHACLRLFPPAENTLSLSLDLVHVFAKVPRNSCYSRFSILCSRTKTAKLLDFYSSILFLYFFS